MSGVYALSLRRKRASSSYLASKYQKWYIFGMTPGLKRVPAYFYRSAGGREPVREWLQGLMPEDRRRIGEDIKDVEYAWPLGMPLVRALGRELWEVRSPLQDGRMARVLFCLHKERMVLLHGFIKKTQKTPQREIELALKRMREER